jgi:DNA-directed RNA polymerase I subunit RPA43
MGYQPTLKTLFLVVCSLVPTEEAIEAMRKVGEEIAEAMEQVGKETIEAMEQVGEEIAEAIEQIREETTEAMELGGEKPTDAMEQQIGEEQEEAGEASLRPALPLGRVKRIIRMDRDIKKVTSEAAMLITAATKLFVGAA